MDRDELASEIMRYKGIIRECKDLNNLDNGVMILACMDVGLSGLRWSGYSYEQIEELVDKTLENIKKFELEDG